MSETDPFAKIASSFRKLVDNAVAPELKRPGKAVYMDSTTEVQNKLGIGEDEVIFSRHRVGKTAVRGIQGLGFVPSHAVEFIERHQFFGGTSAQTMFGLRDDDRIVRRHLVRTQLIGPSVMRELDVEEAGALVDYLSSPIINLGQRALAFRLTKEEKQTIETRTEEDQRAADELQEDLAEIARARRRGEAEARNTILY